MAAKPKSGAVVHVELSSNDLAASKKFYEKIFGWKFKKEMMGEGMEYWTFKAPSGPNGGMMKPMGGMPPGVMNYLLVKSVDATLKKISAGGGKIVMPKQEIPEIGWFALFRDPGGVAMAIFQTK